jgi:hypothetical protein
LATACGAEFLKRSGTSEGRYKAGGRAYRIRLSVNRPTKGETIIDVVYDNAPEKSPRGKADLDVGRLWKCLDETLKLPTWYCRAIFEYPPTGYDLKYRLPSPLDRPIEGFSEIRGIRLARTVEGKALYSVIVDRPDNEKISCTLYFTMQISKHHDLAEDAFRNATEIVKFVIAPTETREQIASRELQGV